MFTDTVILDIFYIIVSMYYILLFLTSVISVYGSAVIKLTKSFHPNTEAVSTFLLLLTSASSPGSQRVLYPSEPSQGSNKYMKPHTHIRVWFCL